MAGLDPAGARGQRGAGRHPPLVRRARVRAGHRRAAAQLVDRALADVEGAGSLPRPPAPRGHLRREGQRGLGPPGRCRGVRQCRVRRRHRRGHGCRRRRPRGARRALQRRRVGGPGGGRPPRAGAGRRRHRAALRVVAAARPGGARHVRRSPGVGRGLGEVQPAPLARRRLRRLRRVLLRADVPRAALDPTAGGGQRLGARRGPADPRRLHVRSARPRRRRAHRPRRGARGGDLPGARAARQRGPGALGRRRRALRRAGAGHDRRARRCGPRPVDARPRRRQPRDRPVRHAGDDRAGWRAQNVRARGALGVTHGAGDDGAAALVPRPAPAAGGARAQLADRAGPLTARPGHRRGACAPSTPTCGCAGWPRTR